MKKVISLIMAIAMCMSCNIPTFAASATKIENSNVSVASSSIIAGKKTGILKDGRGSITLNLSKGNYFANHKVKISGEPGVEYYVSIKCANGHEDTFNSITGSGTTSKTQGYAQAGTYTYYVSAFGISKDITVTVWIED